MTVLRSVYRLPRSGLVQEIKWDGYRALAIKHGREAALVSRRNNSLTSKFPSIAAGLSTVESGSILDGEIVALDVDGKPSFNLLQHHKENVQGLVYYVLDVPAYRGCDVRQLNLPERRGLLDEILKSAQDPVRLSPILDAAPQDLVAAVKAQGLEGIIEADRQPVRIWRSKRCMGQVQSKQRSGTGYRRLSRGKRQFRQSCVGYYDQRDRLIFIAKIKNGFTPGLKKQIFDHLRKLEIKICPFDNLPEPKAARRGEAPTAESMKNYQWVKPQLVAQVEFTDWTAADHLRHSRFVALREDKDPKDARKES